MTNFHQSFQLKRKIPSNLILTLHGSSLVFPVVYILSSQLIFINVNRNNKNLDSVKLNTKTFGG